MFLKKLVGLRDTSVNVDNPGPEEQRPASSTKSMRHSHAQHELPRAGHNAGTALLRLRKFSFASQTQTQSLKSWVSEADLYEDRTVAEAQIRSARKASKKDSADTPKICDLKNLGLTSLPIDSIKKISSDYTVFLDLKDLTQEAKFDLQKLVRTENYAGPRFLPGPKTREQMLEKNPGEQSRRGVRRPRVPKPTQPPVRTVQDIPSLQGLQSIAENDEEENER